MSGGFESLGLSEELLRAVREKGYLHPTPIQREAVPAVLEGHDLMGGAQTGTGKTAAFTLPLLQRLRGGRHHPTDRAVRALILTPTRELAAQVHASVCDYGRHLPYKASVVFGGVSMERQVAEFRGGVDIVVATPGRLLDHVRQGQVRLGAVEIFVLDEADRMLDMGFLPDIRKVMKELPENRQTLLFSATFPDEIERLCQKLLKSPRRVQVARKSTAAESVKQVVIPVSHKGKHPLLSHLIRTEGWRQVLVFTRTKARANQLTKKLVRDGVHAVAIHGNKSQGARTRALAGFKNGEVQALIATDIAARGLDIDQLPHVVNFDLPNISEDYVHRIGRTGRAGREGEALSLVSPEEREHLDGIERLLRKKIPRRTVEGITEPPGGVAEPPKTPHTGGGRGRSSGGGRRGGGRSRNRRGGGGGGGSSSASSGQAQRPPAPSAPPGVNAGNKSRRGGRNRWRRRR